jgi:hypothetical protein
VNFTFIKNDTRLRHTAFAVAPRWRHVIKLPPVRQAAGKGCDLSAEN